MPRLTVPIQKGELLVDVLVSAPGATLAKMRSQGLSLPSPIWAKGQIDTGSTISAVSQVLLQRLNILPLHFSSTQGIGGLTAVALYEASLSITSQMAPGRPLFSPPDRIVTDLNVPDVDVLIGMDILELCKLTIDGPTGLFILEF